MIYERFDAAVPADNEAKKLQAAAHGEIHDAQANQSPPAGPKMTLVQIARICHDANAAYCVTLHDHSRKRWAFAPAWQRNSVIASVEHALANPATTPLEIHEHWLKAQRADGWIHGYTKNFEAKTHPDIVPYDDLPREQQVKDHLLLAIIRAMTPYTKE